MLRTCPIPGSHLALSFISPAPALLLSISPNAFPQDFVDKQGDGHESELFPSASTAAERKEYIRSTSNWGLAWKERSQIALSKRHIDALFAVVSDEFSLLWTLDILLSFENVMVH